MRSLQDQVAETVAAAQRQAAENLRELALSQPDIAVAEFVSAMGDFANSVSIGELLGVAGATVATTKTRKQKTSKAGGRKKTKGKGNKAPKAAAKAKPAAKTAAGKNQRVARKNDAGKEAYKESVLAALGKVKKPMKSRILRAKVGGNANQFLYMIKQLVKAGKVKAVGATTLRTYEIA